MAPSDNNSDRLPHFGQFSTNDPDAYFGRLIGLLEAHANGEPVSAASALVTDGAEADPITNAVDFRLRNGTSQIFETLGEALVPPLSPPAAPFHHSS
jgi:hypothetical protein